LDELAKIARQKNWLQGEGQEEREAILSLKQGKIYQEQKKYTEALQVYLAVKEQLTQPLDSLKNSLGKALKNLGDQLGSQEKPDYQTAVIAYQHSSELYPQNDGTWFGLGIALDEVGRLSNEPLNKKFFEEAIASYDKALKIKPDYHEAWYNRGNSLANLGRKVEAIASFDKAIEIKPDYHEAWYNRGNSLENLGRKVEAIASYDKALEIKPDNHEAWYNRGVALAYLGRYKEAIASYDKALKIKPDKHEAYYNKACCYALHNQIDLALEFLPKAIELDAKLLEMAKTDNDFDSIRDDPRFQTLIFLE